MITMDFLSFVNFNYLIEEKSDKYFFQISSVTSNQEHHFINSHLWTNKHKPEKVAEVLILNSSSC